MKYNIRKKTSTKKKKIEEETLSEMTNEEMVIVLENLKVFENGEDIKELPMLRFFIESKNKNVSFQTKEDIHTLVIKDILNRFSQAFSVKEIIAKDYKEKREKKKANSKKEV